MYLPTSFNDSVLISCAKIFHFFELVALEEDTAAVAALSPYRRSAFASTSGLDAQLESVNERLVGETSRRPEIPAKAPSNGVHSKSFKYRIMSVVQLASSAVNILLSSFK